MLGQDRHQAEDQRQFTVGNAAEIEPHRQGIERFGLGDLRVILAMVGTAMVAQQGPGKQHVVGAYRLAVRETRQRIEAEGDVGPQVVGLDALGQQAVQRERLVIAARHQAFIDIAALEPVAADLLHCDTADDQRIEAVESAEQALHQPSPFRGVGIGVGHMAVIGRQRRRTVHRDGVAWFRCDRLGVAGDQEGKGEGASGERQNARGYRNPTTIPPI